MRSGFPSLEMFWSQNRRLLSVGISARDSYPTDLYLTLKSSRISIIIIMKIFCKQHV